MTILESVSKAMLHAPYFALSPEAIRELRNVNECAKDTNPSARSSAEVE